MSMNNVFPESMNKIDTENVTESLKRMEDYIAYMCERIDFYVNNMSKNQTTMAEAINKIEAEMEKRDKETALKIDRWELVSGDNGFIIRKRK